MRIDQRDADAALGDEVHAHSSWILPAILLVFAGLVGVVVFYFLTAPSVVDEIQGSLPNPSASPAAADIRIDGVLFRIPANYTIYRRSRYNGDHEDVPLHALLPNLSPWSADDASAFASDAPDSLVVQILLKIDRAPMTYQQTFERGIKPGAQIEDGEPGPFGLTQYKFGPDTVYENTEWFTARLDDGSELVMRCDVSANSDFGSSCMRVTRLQDTVGLTYKFKRAHLAQWKQIEARVMGLVASFQAD